MHSFETSVLIEATRRHFPEEGIFYVLPSSIFSVQIVL
jgi:hypothetical protein